MASRSPARPRQSASTINAISSPSRSSPAGLLDPLYNNAVQAFVRRDHAKAFSALKQLLGILSSQPATTAVWYEIDGPALAGSEKELYDWRSRTLKLYISACVSQYSDPTSSNSLLNSEIQVLLPPSSPDKILRHLQQTCEAHCISRTTSPRLLPPSLISTLLLAALKLQPARSALDFAHRLAEDWIAGLPDSTLLAISTPHGLPSGDHNQKKQVESMREGYIKVIELFVGEVLVKEGEWDMARSFLEGEGVLGSKRKESLYKHIRSAQSRINSHPSSPSNSLILPSPSSSGILPSISHSAASSRTRSRTSSASSSSSEATARPTNAIDRLGISRPTRRSTRGKDRNGEKRDKGKEKAAEVDADDEKEAIASISTKSSLPSRLFINHSPANSTRGDHHTAAAKSGAARRAASTAGAGWEALLILLPKPIQERLRPVLSNPWLLAAISIPIPLAMLIATILLIRRKLARSRASIVATAANVASIGGTTAAVDALSDVRARLRAARDRGIKDWLKAWIGWWIRKFMGVWKMGTTITYL